MLESIMNQNWNAVVSYALLLGSFMLFISLIFSKIRRKFPYKVNCWFCNSNSKVSYEKRNAFNCPKCTQYNGFTQDGDYNREIPEQKHSKFNLDKTKSFCQRSVRAKPALNGFCTICNRNQELKVQQLAAFVPQNENNYDTELNDYKRKLEDSYQLCPECQRHLKRVLTRVKTNVLGAKLAQIGIRGLKAIDSRLQGGKSSEKGSKRFRSLKILTVILIILISTVNFIKDSPGILKTDWKGLVNGEIYKFFVVIYSHCAAFKETTLHLLEKSDIFVNLEPYLGVQEFWEQLHFEEIINLLPLTAVIFNVLLMSLNTQHIKHYIVTLFLLWSIKMCLSDFEIASPYLEWIKFSLASTILLTTLRMWNCLEVPEVEKDSSFHRLYSECADESDTEFDYSEGSVMSQQTIRSRSRIEAKSATRLNTTLPMSTATYQPSVLSLNASRTLINDYLEKLEPPTELNQSFVNYRPNDSIPKYSDTFESLSAKNDIKNSSFFELQDSVSQKSFSFRPIKENEFQVQQDITKLQIGSSRDSVRDFPGSKNPFSLDRSQCSTPTPSLVSFTSSAVRYNVVQPPRLVDSDPSASSWVAGGYWGSPQKRNLEKSLLSPPLSRTSSQSSGFESSKDKNSRESSIDKFSAFSESMKPTRNLFLQDSSGNSTFLRKPLLTPQISALHKQTFNSSSLFSQNLDKSSSTLPNSNSRQFGNYRDSFFKY